MKAEELETIVGLLSGMEAAIMHLADVVAGQSGTEKALLAKSFREAAERLPPEMRGRELASMILHRIAEGMERHHAADLAEALRAVAD